MPHRLKKVPFSEELSATVQGFYCGDEPWEREVSDWIKGVPGGVFDDVQRGCEVWLYVTEEHGLVGFGSLAPSRWRWPHLNSEPVRINLIPMLGIQRQFWGKPEGPPEERYSAQILDDLIYEAGCRRDRLPLVALFVHPDNRRAIRAYEKAGFVRYSKTYTDKTTGAVYQGMLLNLSAEPTPL